MRNRLNEMTGLRLPATLVFDHPTPAALTERILALLGIEQAASGPEAVLAEIDRLEAAISALDPANGKLSRINARLRALTSRVSGLKGEAEGPAKKFSIESSSDDEIFSFIDDQLT
jgi:hypothetical protein